MKGDVDFKELKSECWYDIESPHKASSSLISESEFSCHCCYHILLSPTTLNCGHSFCRHCLALWWESSRKTVCPECRARWEGFPKVNILLRDAVEKLFPQVVVERRGEVDSSPRIIQSLSAFQRYGDDQASRGLNPLSGHRPRGSGFFSGVLAALTCVAVMLLVCHWSSRELQQDLLLHKPVTKWTAEDVILWLEQLGPWASLYKERFLEEQVNGRLLMTLEEEEFAKSPFSIENHTHRKAVLLELERVKALGVKPPQNLWEYRAVNGGKSLFLVYALKSSPRLTLLYLYLFDYTETFLPFMHTSCPGSADAAEEPDILTKHLLNDPSWMQWVEFLVKYSLLPYQLMAEFAWDWLAVHYWTSRFIIVNAMLLSVLEGFTLWRLWSRGELRALPHRMWSHFWKVSTQGLLVAIVWPMIPQFICNCLFYWALYFNPIINIDLVLKEVRRLETRGP
ncbi:bifunctional apoptosis regulator-like isoform X2 [Acipenser oxyrinchus oxyrinchus]|uniref:Bifunctional apoptosis regulator n=1 Tax=Acipenser oxyrinchus oxyrinchus TaxID=40147 RepID=A0AAD8G0F6_ACIOX|nr:bifunctional apoptosis regulator-like isoform X2 [Acipenser oxyrinchus oxyrinchus]